MEGAVGDAAQKVAAPSNLGGDQDLVAHDMPAAKAGALHGSFSGVKEPAPLPGASLSGHLRFSVRSSAGVMHCLAIVTS